MTQGRPRHSEATETSYNDFVQLDDGETIILELLDAEPQQVKRHWVGDGSEDCEGPTCVWCRRGNRRRSRYIIEVKNEADTLTWDMSKTVWREVRGLSRPGGSLQGLAVKLTRRGEGRDTVYDVERAFEGQASRVSISRATPSQAQVDEEQRQRRYPDHYAPEPPPPTDEVPRGAVDVLVTSIRELCLTAQFSPKEFVVSAKAQLRKDLQREPSQMETLYYAEKELQTIVASLQEPGPPENVEDLF